MKILTTFGASCLLIFLVYSMASASPTKRLDERTQACRIFTQNTLWDGFKAFDESCKKCHFTGNDQGANFLHSESKVQNGWNRAFTQRYPLCAKNGSWGDLSQETLQRINDYLYKNAADAYDPYDAEDCG